MRVAIVNDLPMAVEALRRALATYPGFQLAWVAIDGQQAVEKCAEDRPDLILMDLIMPIMDGVEATRRIMQNTPCAILVVTATVDGNISKVFEAMGAGALDAVNTPPVGNPQAQHALLRKLALVERLIEKSSPTPDVPVIAGDSDGKGDGHFLVAIGASTGGPRALADVLEGLDGKFGGSLVIVQHVDEAFAVGLVDWLRSKTPLDIRLAREGDKPRPGRILLAGTNDHIVMAADGTLYYTKQPADCPYRPSVDVFFRSLAINWPGRGAAVLMTGMGRDGAEGLCELQQAGWATFAQDEGSSVVYGMPKAAIELNPTHCVLSLDMIGQALVEEWEKHS